MEKNTTDLEESGMEGYEGKQNRLCLIFEPFCLIILEALVSLFPVNLYTLYHFLFMLFMLRFCDLQMEVSRLIKKPLVLPTGPHNNNTWDLPVFH